MYNGYFVVKAVTALHSRWLQLGAEILACIMTTACPLVMMVAVDDAGNVVVAITRKCRATSNNNCKLLCKHEVGREHLKINFPAGCRSPTPQDSN